ncbi:hypothetical protein UVIVOLLU_CDS0021 [Salmonella phage PHA46_2]
MSSLGLSISNIPSPLTFIVVSTSLTINAPSIYVNRNMLKSC